jgi:hypothetical protein
MDKIFDSLAQGAALPPEAAEHLAGCERCQGLMRLLVRPSVNVVPDGERMQRIRAEMLRDLKPVRPMASPSVLFAIFAMAFLAVAAVGAVQLHPVGWKLLSLAQKLAILAALGMGAGVLGLSMVRQMRPGSRYAIAPSILPAGVLLLLGLAFAAVFQSTPETGFIAHGLRCLSVGLIYAVAGGIVCWLWLRKGAALSPKLMGTTAGAFAALIGIAVLESHCPNLNRNHILVWHLGVFVVCAAFGVTLGAIIEGKRRRFSAS